jgi:purine-nucleoside phosphorylase
LTANGRPPSAGRLAAETDRSSVDAAHIAGALLRERLGKPAPRLAMILGSGLGSVVDRFENARRVSYSEIPDFPTASVAGHKGEVVAGFLEGVEVLAFSGRSHLYEGHSAAIAALPVRVAHALGARVLLVANAGGGIRRTLRPGDIMIIRDQINLMGRNPLTGPARAGEPRFPDMSAPYDAELATLLREVALQLGVSVAEGVYAGVSGPSYETPAEIRMLDRIGADAVAMSIIPEVIAARALGMRVAGLSCITNAAAGISGRPLDHREVVEVAARISASVALLTAALARGVRA